MTDKRIHIALTRENLADDYNRHVGATLLSILEHSSQSVVVHLLYNEMFCVGKEKEVEYNKACYNRIAEEYECELQYHHIELPEWVNNLESVKKWTSGTLMKIYLPELLPDVDKIIYFDCDMIINTDIFTLWNTHLNNTPLAACLDPDIPYFSNKRIDLYRKVEIPISSYFCAGVLIFNLKLLRCLKDTLSNILLTFLQDNPTIPFLDQDMLNWFCQGNYTKLDEKYNIYTYRNVLALADDGIIHYAASWKPWVRYHGKIDDYYWEYLSKTPWCEDVHIFYSYLRSVPDMSMSLSILEDDFFANVNGTKWQKICYAIHFVYCIAKSFRRGLRDTLIKQ